MSNIINSSAIKAVDVKTVIDSAQSSGSSKVQDEGKKLQQDIDALQKDPNDAQAAAKFTKDYASVVADENGGSLSAADMASLKDAARSAMKDAGVSDADADNAVRDLDETDNASTSSSVGG